VTVDQLLVQVTPLETQVGVLSSTITDTAAELHAKKLSLERTTATKGDFQGKNACLTKNLKGESSLRFSINSPISLTDLYVLLAVVEAELKTLKTVAENAVKYFYSQDSDAVWQTPELLDQPLTRSREVIHSNMCKASSLTLRILKSLYPKEDLGAGDEGFAPTCTEEEANELVRRFLEMVTWIVEMIPLNPVYL
jgi:hypothetical protein